MSSRRIHSTESIILVAAVLCMTMIWITQFGKFADRYANPSDDDYVYLFFAGFQMFGPESVKTIHDRMLEYLFHTAVDDDLYFRAVMRYQYVDNYPFTTGVIYLTGLALHAFQLADPLKDFAAFLARSIYVSMIAVGVWWFAVTAAIILWLRDHRFAIAAALGMALATLSSEFIPSPTGSFNVIMQMTPTPPAPELSFQTVVATLIHHFISPSRMTSLFGIDPRNNMAVLAVGLFALRWTGRTAASYWLLVVFMFIHRSSGAFMLAIVLSCDLLVRARHLWRWPVLVPLLTCALLTVGQEKMASGLNLAGDYRSQLHILAGIVAILALMAWRYRHAIASAIAATANWQERRFARIPLTATDLAIFVFGFFATIPLVFVLIDHVDPYQVNLLWSQLHLRVIGIMQWPILTGVLYLGLTQFRRAEPQWAAVSMTFLVSIFCVWQAAHHPWQGPTSKIQLAAGVAHRLATETPKLKTPTIRDEVVWYYAIAEEAVTGAPRLDQLFR